MPAAPFPGLRALRPEEAHRLRGRDALVASLVAQLREGASLLLVSPPGVGRSSLLAAGLLPALRDAPGDLDAPAYRATAPRGLLPRYLPPGASLHDAHREIISAGHTPVLLVDDADALLEDASLLQQIARAPDVRLVCALADRTRLPALRRELAVVPVDPLPADALAATLTDADVPLVPGLAQAMAAELGDDPAALAWIQFAAMRLWQTRERPDAPLTHTALRALGGVRGSLTRYAEATLAARPLGERRVAPALLGQLVTPEGVARFVDRERLLGLLPAARDDAAALLDALEEAGLVTSRGGAVGVAHAVLVAAWPLLAARCPRPAERVASRTLAPAARARHRGLTAGAALALGALAHLGASRLVRAREAAAEALASSRAEVAPARERLGARRIEAMTVRVRTIEQSDREAGLMVALAAYDLARAEGLPVEPAVALVRDRTNAPVTLRLVGHEGRVTAATYAPDGARLATASTDGTVRLWSATLGRPLARLDLGPARAATALAFSADSERLAVATLDGRVFVLDAHNGATDPPWAACEGAASWVGWSRDRSRLLVGCARGDLGALDASTRRWAWRRAVAASTDRPRFETDGARVLVNAWPTCCRRRGELSWPAWRACEDSGEALTLDVATGAVRTRTPVDACYEPPIALDPDGDGILLGQHDGRVTGRPTAHDRYINCQNLFPEPHGGPVVARCLEGLSVFGAAGQAPLAEALPIHGLFLLSHSSTAGIVFSTDASADNSLSVWDPMGSAPRLRVARTSNDLTTLAFAPTGDTLAVTARGSTVDLWSARPPPRHDPASLLAWALPRTNLRVCRGSLKVAVFTGGALPDSPWMPPSVHPCAEVSP